MYTTSDYDKLHHALGQLIEFKYSKTSRIIAERAFDDVHSPQSERDEFDATRMSADLNRCEGCDKPILTVEPESTPAGSMHPRCARAYERRQPQDW